MAEIELSEVAQALLKTLVSGPGCLPDIAELNVLWEKSYVIGSATLTHITQQGKAILVALRNQASMQAKVTFIQKGTVGPVNARLSKGTRMPRQAT